MSLKNTLRTIKYCVLSKRYPLHNKSSESIEPFFIIGSGRSGNTLLRRILNNHSELFIPPETYDVGPSIQQFRVFNKMGWDNIVKLIYANFEFSLEFHTFGMDSLSDLYGEVSKYDEEKQSMAYVLNAFYEHYREKHNIRAMRWGDKTPLNTLYINEIFEVFPNAKFIHITRDPYDVIHSYVKSGIYTNYRDAAKRWKISIEKATEFGEKYPNNYYEVEYEQLVDNPELCIQKVCKFLAIEYEENMIQMSDTSNNLGDVQKLQHHANVLKPISKDNIGKGIRSLSKEDLLIINNVLGDSKNKNVRGRMVK